MNRNAFPPATWVAIVLSVIGALNWGLVGLFDFNLVSALFGPMSTLSRVVYVLVGLGGLYLLFAAATAESRAAPRGTV
jgi:uncharacterized membrane protein YuzA (DUF378 family)